MFPEQPESAALVGCRWQEEVSQDWRLRAVFMALPRVLGGRGSGGTVWDIIHQNWFSVEVLIYEYSWLYHYAAFNKPSIF